MFSSSSSVLLDRAVPCPNAKLLANSRFTIYSLSTGGNSGLMALVEEGRGAENNDISDEVA